MDSMAIKGGAHSAPSAAANHSRRGRAFAVSGGIVVLVVAILAVLGMSHKLGGGANEATSPELRRVSVESFQITVSTSGELEAENQTEIRSELETPADIVEIVDEGKRVTKGTVLIRLNNEAITNKIEDQMLSVEAARNDLVAAKNALAIQISENDAALRKTKLKVDLAQIDLEKWTKGDVVKRRLELTTNLEKAKRDSKRLTEKLGRSKELYKRSFLSKDNLQQDEIAALGASAALERAQKEQEVYETYDHVRDQKQKTSDLEEAQAELERVNRQNESRLASKKADVTNRQRQLSIREKRLAKYEKQLAASTLTAPADGLVVYGTSVGFRRYSFGSGDGALQIGRTVRPNELLIILPDTSSIVASVRVQESVAGRIHPGQRANIRVDAIQNTVFTGEVTSVGVLAESGGWLDPNLREYTVKIKLDGDNTSQKLKPSMRVDAQIVLGDVADAIAVPVQSIFHEGKISYVYTPSGSKFVKTPVRVGRRSTTMAEITAGLDVGQSVLLREPSAGEVLDREFAKAALAAIAPVPGEDGVTKVASRVDAPKPPQQPEIDVAAIRNNPDIPAQAREKMKKMSDDEIKKMARQRQSDGSPKQGAPGRSHKTNSGE